jgi:mRNA interferase RelE/StbE
VIYTVIYSDEADKVLGKLDGSVRRRILLWIHKNLIGTENPKAHGKGLTGNLSGYWRYRVGDYRLLAKIYEATVEIEIVEIGHRSEIYN